MRRVFLLLVVLALFVILGFVQAPAADNTDQTNVKGCLGGSDGNYTIAEDGTRQIFKITTSSVDLKLHLGQAVELTGQKASEAASSAAANNSFAVTALSIISEHCAAAAAPVGTVIPSTDTVIAPTAATAAPSATASAPAVDAAAPVTTVSPSSATVSMAPVEAIPPAAAVTAPAAKVISPPSTAVNTPAATAAQPTQLAAHPRKVAATQAVAATTPAAAVSPSSETIIPSDATATKPADAAQSSEPGTTPPAAATIPIVAPKSGPLFLLISFVVLVLVLAMMAPLLLRWRKRKLLERTGTPDLSFSHKASSDRDKPEPRKVA
jgi:hypothetical protein